MTDPQNPFEFHPALKKLASGIADATAEAQAAAVAQRDAELEDIAAQDAARRLWQSRGKRYRRCTVDNFQVSCEEQRVALGHIRRFADNIDAEIHMGTNLLLTGDPGTGKDHLMAALLTTAMTNGHYVKWTSGAMLFARLRDSIDAHEDEYSVAREYTLPAVLAISDPAWEREPLTRFQRERLGYIIDVRYNHQRPIWVTLNTKDRGQANDLLGEALVDRLRHEALSLGCNWPSYRKPRPQEKVT